MTDIIKLLPDSVANQIAAGEVIQRPASAVKELLENAVDSGATDITLNIRDAGKTLIQVTDNGCGMSVMDARMSFERHATSKINKAEDLFAIRTMGFRGEALASIAAISQVELKTRPHDDELGTHIKIEGSKLISQDACQVGAGTNIMVKNLFFNVPARRNFLKSNTAETRHIIEEFIRVAVINYGLAFSFINNDKTVFKLNKGGFKSRIVGLFGHSYNEKLLAVEQVTDQLSVKGFIAKPEYAKKTRGEQYFFVNGRFIKHPYLHHAVANAFTELIPADSFPSYFLNIEIDPQDIDINIHPTKTEVNFKDARYLYAVLHAAVKQSVGRHSLTPTIDFDVDPGIESALGMPPDSEIQQPGVQINPEYNPFNKSASSKSEPFIPDRKKGDTQWQKLFEKPENENSGDKDHGEDIYVGIDKSHEFMLVHNKYLISMVRSGLLVVDKKGALERIYYEQFLKQLSGKKNISQQQLFPVTLSFAPGDAEIIRSLADDLTKLGFVIENFGTNSFVVNGIPTSLRETEVNSMLEKIIENHKKEAHNLTFDKNTILARTMAANLKAKENTPASQAEMEDIINRLFACDVPAISPSGQKIVKIISLEEFDQLMKK